jgi:hypothetical protein
VASVSLIATCGLAMASYHGLEPPFLRFKQSVYNRGVAGGLGLIMITGISSATTGSSSPAKPPHRVISAAT